MYNLEKLLAEAESQEGDEQWELLEGYDVKDFYSDDQGYVRISGKQIENISENISVSGEDNSQYIEFRMNRFYDGIDLSKMILSIHYEGDGSGDESPIINAYRNSDEIKFGWAIPATATQYNEIEFCVWARGSLEDDSSYVLKTLPKTYKINRGLILGGEIPEPTNNWYLNFVRTMDAKVSVATLCADETQKNAEAVTEMNANVNTKSEQIDSQYTNIETWHQETKTNTEAAKKYYEDTKAISEGISGALKPMGTMAFIELPDLEDVSVGDMYNISDQFVTTEDFREGAGKIIPLGSNIYKTSDGKWDVLAGSPVTGVKGAVEEQYRSGNVDITPENIGLGNVQSDISLNRQTLGYVKKNLWAHGDVSGTLSVPVGVSGEIKAGTYTISALVKSSDTDSARSIVGYSYEDGSASKYIYFNRNERHSKTVTFEKDVVTMVFYASETYNLSTGDTFTWSDIQIEVGSTATDYEPYVDDVDTRLKALTPVNNLLATVPGSPLDATMGEKLAKMIAAIPTITFATEEPDTVPENTIVMVYEE